MASRLPPFFSCFSEEPQEPCRARLNRIYFWKIVFPDWQAYFLSSSPSDVNMPVTRLQFHFAANFCTSDFISRMGSCLPPALMDARGPGPQPPVDLASLDGAFIRSVSISRSRGGGAGGAITPTSAPRMMSPSRPASDCCPWFSRPRRSSRLDGPGNVHSRAMSRQATFTCAAILARPPGHVKQAGKYLRRNAAAVTVATLSIPSPRPWPSERS